MDIVLNRTVADMTYKKLRDYLEESEDEMDLCQIQNWLEDQIAKNLHKRGDAAENYKKACHLALLFIDYAIEPGKGSFQ